MAFVMQGPAACGPYRRTVKSSGRRYCFEPGQALEVPDQELAELLAASTGMLVEVAAEMRGEKFRRWRPVTAKPKPARPKRRAAAAQ